MYVSAYETEGLLFKEKSGYRIKPVPTFLYGHGRELTETCGALAVHTRKQILVQFPIYII